MKKLAGANGVATGVVDDVTQWERFRRRLRDWWFRFQHRKVYAAVLKNHKKYRERLNNWAAEFGYAGKDSMEAACLIAKRCARAEASLRELAEARARALAVAGLPGLSRAQIERLAWLQEECGEVIQAAGKIMRHGYESSWPPGGATNRVALERELGDLQAAVQLMENRGDLRAADLRIYRCKKAASISKWMHHQ
jgi:NTP pyrophosphatase (non-canonical NTP hydrolase)